MNALDLVLNGIGPQHVPQHAAPIVDELRKLLERAVCKTEKYVERDPLVAMWHMAAEKVRL